MHPSKKNAKLNAVSDRLNDFQQRVRARTFDVNPGLAITAGLFLLLSASPSSLAQKVKSAPPPPPPAARPHRETAPVTNITVDASEPMFATMCALLASGFEADISAENWRPLRAQLRDRMQHQQGPAVEAIREYYKQHDSADPGAALSRYLWFGLAAGPAPDFKPTMRREDLPPEVLALEGFSELLSKYYQEQNIHQLWRQMQPAYNAEIERMHEAVSQIVFVATGYLRAMNRPSEQRTFTIIVEPLVGHLTNVRNFGDHYAIVLSGADDIPADVVRHAYLHFMLDPLPLRYSHVIAVKKPLFEKAASAPRLAPDLKDDYPSFFAECMVRAVELKLRRMSPGERDAALERNDADGYVLVRPLFAALPKFEGAEPSMELFFPDLVRSIDVATELKRVSTLQFASGDSHRNASDLNVEEVARRRAAAMPGTVPNDADAIAALTEGERRIAEKNARAAEVSFQKVVAKYPDQPRAWYGLGLVALLDHDGPRAKEVFGRLTTGEHAATSDPMVLAWSHIYLARIYDGEGQPRQAEAEYQAALTVQGGPELARQAAQKGLADTAREKPVERP
jgi:tetratricopeptide (TPR) repeat protein